MLCKHNVFSNAFPVKPNKYLLPSVNKRLQTAASIWEVDQCEFNLVLLRGHLMRFNLLCGAAMTGRTWDSTVNREVSVVSCQWAASQSAHWGVFPCATCRLLRTLQHCHYQSSSVPSGMGTDFCLILCLCSHLWMSSEWQSRKANLCSACKQRDHPAWCGGFCQPNLEFD